MFRGMRDTNLKIGTSYKFGYPPLRCEGFFAMLQEVRLPVLAV